jgi:hypothetical protein
MEQRWIERENPKYLLNFKNATKEEMSLNWIKSQLENLKLNDKE